MPARSGDAGVRVKTAPFIAELEGTVDPLASKTFAESMVTGSLNVRRMDDGALATVLPLTGALRMKSAWAYAGAGLTSMRSEPITAAMKALRISVS
jgi:uncharacterized protein YcsI (UPF0317 family)